MENQDELASGVRITRALRKRLNSVDSDSRPASPFNPKLSTIMAKKDMPSVPAPRTTRRNSIHTPVKTPSKTKGMHAITPDVESPALRTTRRLSLYIDEEECLSNTKTIIKEPELFPLAEEETVPTAVNVSDENVKDQGSGSLTRGNGNTRSAAASNDNATAVNGTELKLIEDLTQKQIKIFSHIMEGANTSPLVRVKRFTNSPSSFSQKLQVDNSHKKAREGTTRSGRLTNDANNEKNSNIKIINLESEDETISNSQVKTQEEKQTLYGNKANTEVNVIGMTGDISESTAKEDSIKNQSAHKEFGRNKTEIDTEDTENVRNTPVKPNTENVRNTPVKPNTENVRNTPVKPNTEVLHLDKISKGYTTLDLNKSKAETGFELESPRAVSSKFQSKTAKSVTFNDSDEENVKKITYPKTPVQVKGKSYMNFDRSTESLDQQSSQSGFLSVVSLRNCNVEQEAEAEEQQQKPDSSIESIELQNTDSEHSVHDEDADLKRDSFGMGTYTMLPEKTPPKPLTRLTGNRQSSTPIVVDNTSENHQKLATELLQLHEEAGAQMTDAEMVKDIEKNHQSDSVVKSKLDHPDLTPEKYLRSGKIYGVSPPLHSPTISQEKNADSNDSTPKQKCRSSVGKAEVTNTPEKSITQTIAAVSSDKRFTPTAMNQSLTTRQTKSPAKVEITKGLYSSTWCHNVRGKVDEKQAKIDEITGNFERVKCGESTNAVEKGEYFAEINASLQSNVDSDRDNSVVDVDHSTEDEEKPYKKHTFVDGEAMEVNANYRSGDSMTEEERREIIDNQIEVGFESIGSQDTEEIEADAEEEGGNSFIDDSYEEQSNSAKFSDDDTDNELDNNNKNKKTTYKRLRLPSSSSTEDAGENDKNEEERKNGNPDVGLVSEVTAMINKSVVMKEKEPKNPQKTSNLPQNEAQKQQLKDMTVVETANNSFKVESLSLNSSKSKKLHNISGNKKLHESNWLLRVDSSDCESYKDGAEENISNTRNTSRKSLEGKGCDDKNQKTVEPYTEQQMSSPAKPKKSLPEMSSTTSGNISGLRQKREIYESNSDDKKKEIVVHQKPIKARRKSMSLTPRFDKCSSTSESDIRNDNAESALFGYETNSSINDNLNKSNTKKCKPFNESLKNRAPENNNEPNNEQRASELDENESAMEFEGFDENEILKRNSSKCSSSVATANTSIEADVDEQQTPLQEEQTVDDTNGNETSKSTSRSAAGLSVSFCSMYQQKKMTAGMHLRGTGAMHLSFDSGITMSGTKNPKAAFLEDYATVKTSALTEHDNTDGQAIESEEKEGVKDIIQSENEDPDTVLEVETEDKDVATNSAEEAGNYEEIKNNGKSNSGANYSLSSDTQEQTSLPLAKRQRRQTLNMSFADAAAIRGETLSIKKTANNKSTGELCINESTQDMNVQQGVNIKRKRLSKSFGSSLDATVNSTPQGVHHLHKKCKLAKYDALEDLSTAVPSSTPQAKPQKVNFDGKNYEQKILERCNEILATANRAKLEEKLKVKKNKVKLPMKNECFSSSRDENETDQISPEKNKNKNSHASGQSVEKKKKERTKTAVEQALKASANIILNPPSKKKQPKCTKKLDDEQPLQTKRLPVHLLESLSYKDEVNAPKRKNKEHAQELEVLRSVHKIHSAAGDVIETPLSPKCHKKLKTIELATGTVTVESLTPKKNTKTRGFRESPITPRTTGFKVHKMLKAGQDTPPELPPTSSGLQRKRKRLIIEEPSYTLPKPQWTQSGFSFVEQTMPIRAIPVESSATRFMVAGLNMEQKKIKKTKKGISPNMINASAIDFKQNALQRTNVPRESSRAVLQRKERQCAYKHF